MASITRQIDTKHGNFVGWSDSDNPGVDIAGLGRLWDFDLGKSELKPEHLSVLNEVGRFLSENPEYFCRVVGLAGRAGNHEDNRKVSDLRARDVHGYLMVIQGVDIQQLVSKKGELFFARGEEFWEAKDYVESGFQRMVVLMIWKHNDPNPADEARNLAYYADTPPL